MSCARRPGKGGAKSIAAVSAGRIVTIALLARTVMRSDSTVTPCWSCAIVRTGEPTSTRLPSFAAMRIESSCDPPTKRLSWAPPPVLIRRTKLPGVRSLPATRRYQRAHTTDSSRVPERVQERQVARLAAPDRVDGGFEQHVDLGGGDVGLHPGLERLLVPFGCAGRLPRCVNGNL